MTLLAKDLRGEFYPYFPQFHNVFVKMLKSHHDAKMIEVNSLT